MADTTPQKAQNTAPAKTSTPESSSKVDPNIVVSEGEDFSGNSAPQVPPIDLTQFTLILTALKFVKRPQAVAPSNVPKNGVDQIQYYESGSTRRLYIYISGTWRYVALT